MRGGRNEAAPAAALVLAALERLVLRRYEKGRRDAEDLDAALEEELERVDAFQHALAEDFDAWDDLEPEPELSCSEECLLLHEGAHAAGGLW